MCFIGEVGVVQVIYQGGSADAKKGLSRPLVCEICGISRSQWPGQALPGTYGICPCLRAADIESARVSV